MAIRSYGKSVKSYDEWVAETAYELTDYCVPTDDNGMCYECTTAGTSSNGENPVEPTWPNIAGQTVADGTVTWTCREKEGIAAALTLTLDMSDAGGFSLKDVWVKSDEAADFLVWGSYDGVDWRYIDTISVPDGARTENHQTFVTAYPHVGAGTSTAANNEIEIVGGE